MERIDRVHQRRFRAWLRRMVGLPILVLIVALIAASCGNSKSSTAPTTASAAGSLPAGHTASESPAVLLGFINQSAGAAGAYPEAVGAAQAAASYINKQLGGVDGHAVKLDVCTTDGTVAASQKCAQQMVADHVLFVIGGLDDNMQAWYNILQSANIPVLGGIPLTDTDFNAKDSYNYFGGDATSIPALALYVHTYLPKVKNVGILTVDLPGALAGIPLLTKPLNAWGIKTTVVKVATTQSDWLPAYLSLKGSGAIIGLFTSNSCVSVANAAASQSQKIPMVVTTCYSADILKQTGDKMNGWITVGNGDDPAGTTHDAEVFQQAMRTYAGPQASVSGFAPASFVNVMTDYESVLKPLGFANLSVTKVIKQVTSPQGGTVFLGGGNYKCPGSPFAAVCDYSVNFFKIENPKEVDPTGLVDSKPALKLALP